MADDPKNAKTMMGMGWGPGMQPPVPGQPPQPGYPPAPQPPGYPQAQPPQAPPYGQPPQAPPYGQPPQAPPYGQPPQAPPYGQPPQAPYAQPPGFTPQPQPWEQQQPPPYGQQPPYGQAPAYGQPPSYPPPPSFPPSPQQPPYGQQPPPQPAWGGPPPGGPPQQQAWGGPSPAGMPHPGWGAPTDQQHGQHGQGRQIAGADATVGVSARVRFIRLTYLHLFGAICAFAGIEWLLFHNEKLATKVSAPLVEFALGGRANWAAVLGIFMVVSIGTHWLANQTRSKPLHYLGLGIYVVAEALIFVPLLAIVNWKTAEILAKGGGNPNIIRDAAYITLGVFGALTISVFVTKKDFSFLRTALVIAGAASLGLIALSLIFGFNLGIVFSIAMVLLAAGQILYETSQVMAHYDPEDYVGASLSLFASVALMFWYVIRILMKLRE